MNTLGNNTKTKITREESWPLAFGFPAASDVSLGQLVVLKDTGEVDKLAASTDRPLGVVVKAGKTGERATVLTPFSAELVATADVDITLGQEVSFGSYDAATFSDKYKPSAANDFVAGIALSDALAGEDVVIGILRSTYKK